MNGFSISDASRSAMAPDQSNCTRCRAAPFCIPARTGQDAPHPPVLSRRIRVARDTRLFQAGDLVGERFYAIYYGTIKYTFTTASNHEKIGAFLMSGDLLALDAIGFRRHHGTAVALEDSEVCEIRYDCMQSRPMLLHGMISKQIAREQITAHWLRNSGAGQRLAAFLLDMSWRHYRRGYSAQRFRLAMSRQDIANFLALSPECLSRELAQFRQDGLLEVEEREITLRDAARLRQLATDSSPAAVPVHPQV
ncbi:helix-turn-helix domain-containing protein [Rugamonas sp. A1-17]|nr:helix-turn-helix domain-containing protein [Rugamonas sp. A1-17]